MADVFWSTDDGTIYKESSCKGYQHHHDSLNLSQHHHATPRRTPHAIPLSVPTLALRDTCNAVSVCVTTSLTSRRFSCFSGAAFGDDHGVDDREHQRDPREVHERELPKAVVRALDGALGRPVEGEVYAAGWTAFTRFPSRA